MNESLEEDRAYLLRSLDDLEREHDAGDLDDADYLVLKEDYTARAAEVLRALGEWQAAPGTDGPGTGHEGAGDGRAANGAGRAGEGVAGHADGAGGPTPGEDPAGHADGAGDAEAGGGPAAAGRSRDARAAGVLVAGVPARGTAARSRWRPVVVGAVLVAFAGATGALVARSAGERTPGAPASGSIAATGPSGGIADQLAEAQELIGNNETLAAIKVYDQIIEKDPEQPEALAYRGWLLRLAGRAAGNAELIDKGMEYIERAVAADPTYPDAHFFRGFVLYQDRRDPAAAVPELRAFLASDPGDDGMVAVVEDLLGRALAESQGRATAPLPAVNPVPATTAP